MATYLLDTTVIIDVINGKRSRDQLLTDLLENGHLLACCAINVIEVYAGMRPAEESRTAAFLETLKYYPITWEVARLAGLIKRDFRKKGVTLSATDVTIAAVALEYQLTLVTDNVKHYPMKELDLYDPSKTRSAEHRAGLHPRSVTPGPRGILKP
jgi:predicted nucleic acid-binding protein